MNRFSERECCIIDCLRQSSQPVTGKALASRLDVSVRTVQNDILSINRLLKLIHSSNKGYFLDKDAAGQLEIRSSVQPVSDHGIIRTLLFANESVDLYELADDNYLSVSALEKKLKQFAPQLAEYGLTLCRSHGQLSVTGTEYSKRQFIRSLVSSEISDGILEIDLDEHFSRLDTKRIRSTFLAVLDDRSCYIESIYKDNLLLNILIAMDRMVAGHHLLVESPDLQPEAFLSIVQDMCSRCSKFCVIDPTPADLNYLAGLLAGQVRWLVMDVPEPRGGEMMDPAFQKTVGDILEKAFGHYLLEIDSSALLQNFALHVQGIVERVKSGNCAENSLLLSLKKKSPFIFDVAVYIADCLNNTFGIVIPESEIGLIAVHIGYLIENSLLSSKKLNVLLCCDEYHHILDKIREGLQSSLHSLVQISVTDRIRKDDIRVRSSDILITTRPVKVYGVQCVTISPFYTINDQLKVMSAIQECMDTRNRAHYRDLFSRYFSPDLYFSGLGLHTKSDVIRFLSGKLEAAGIVGTNFMSSVEQRERMSSTCFFGTFAIPHALELDAVRTQCAVYVDPEGIEWDGFQIPIVMMIAVQKSDRSEFVELYEALITRFEDAEMVYAVSHTKTFREFFQALGL